MSIKEKRLVFCMHSLQAGGMERVCSQLMCYLTDHTNLEIHLILFGKDPEFFFHVPTKVIKHVPDTKFNEARRTLSTLRRTIKSLEKFDKLKDLIIEETDLNFHVIAGRYESYKEARKYLNYVNQMGYKGWIKKSNCNLSAESIHQSNRKTTFKVTLN